MGSAVQDPGVGGGIVGVWRGPDWVGKCCRPKAKPIWRDRLVPSARWKRKAQQLTVDNQQ